MMCTSCLLSRHAQCSAWSWNLHYEFPFSVGTHRCLDILSRFFKWVLSPTTLANTLSREYAARSHHFTYSFSQMLSNLSRSLHTVYRLHKNALDSNVIYPGLIYRIAGNYWGRKISQILWFCGYTQKFPPAKFGAWRPLAWQKWAIRESFLQENHIFHQFAKVFSLESSPLYGVYINYMRYKWRAFSTTRLVQW